MAFSVAVYFATSAVAAQLKRCSAPRGALQHEAPIGSRCRDPRKRRMALSTVPGGFRPEPGFEAEKDPKARCGEALEDLATCTF